MSYYQNLSIEDLPDEMWKDIPEYEGIYQISSYGRVKCISDMTERGKYGKIRIMKQHLIKKGYCRLTLRKAKKFLINRLVAQAFIPNPENKPEVNHLNTIKTDNYYKNLEWATGSENVRHAVKNNLLSGPKNERTKNFALRIVEIIELKKRLNLSNREIGRRFNITHGSVGRLIKSKA